MSEALAKRKRHYCRPALTSLLLATVLVALLAGCDQHRTNTSQAAKHSTPAATAITPAPGTIYLDPKLGFRLTLPIGWQATSYPGRNQPSGNTLISLQEPSPTPATITIGVFHGASMPAAFAVRGTPPLRIGAYPAFAADTGLSQGKVPCVVRILLASDDYVLAEWCSMDATSHAGEFERILATYLPAPADYRPPSTAVAPAASSCANIQAGYGYDTPSWGRILAMPSATGPNGGWASLAGTYICSNTGSPDRYLFQCTELVNRYDAEQWGLPHIPGNAARYFDYYQNGVLHPGDVRDLPVGSYAYSDDARQGRSAFAPQPGDLLVFQDIANPARGWTSGLIASPGHIALITAVDATHVYIAQENYNDRQYFLALALAHTARGYTISDRSGVAGRIVRGWMRFTVEDR
ncbi:MAG TPA: CHAP domain-containing protein [Ktedonobacterales bacterium]|nr:CHAP domain-containing protein [Ktedonobacterales bacterium]